MSNDVEHSFTDELSCLDAGFLWSNEELKNLDIGLYWLWNENTDGTYDPVLEVDLEFSEILSALHEVVFYLEIRDFDADMAYWTSSTSRMIDLNSESSLTDYIDSNFPPGEKEYCIYN